MCYFILLYNTINWLATKTNFINLRWFFVIPITTNVFYNVQPFDCQISLLTFSSSNTVQVVDKNRRRRNDGNGRNWHESQWTQFGGKHGTDWSHRVFVGLHSEMLTNLFKLLQRWNKNVNLLKLLQRSNKNVNLLKLFRRWKKNVNLLKLFRWSTLRNAN